MKTTYSWKRNTPSTLSGESITVTIVYSSFDKGEIDDLEKSMPKGILMMDSNNVHSMKTVQTDTQDKT